LMEIGRPAAVLACAKWQQEHGEGAYLRGARPGACGTRPEPDDELARVLAGLPAGPRAATLARCGPRAS
jgi:hypothetical protein